MTSTRAICFSPSLPNRLHISAASAVGKCEFVPSQCTTHQPVERNLHYAQSNVVSTLLSRTLIARRKRKQEGKKTGSQPPEEDPAPKVRIIRRTGMNSPMVVSEKLQLLTKRDMMTRPEVVREVVRYVRVKQLFVERDRRFFRCDAYLTDMLGVEGEQLVLRIQKWLGPHLRHPVDVGPQYVERSHVLFQEYLDAQNAVDSSKISKKDPRGFNSEKAQKALRAQGQGMFIAVEIDPILQPICGGRERLSRPQALKAVWDYIKSNDLQDPSNRRIIITDDKLRTCLQMGDLKKIDCFQLGGFVMKLCYRAQPAKNNKT